MARGKWFRGVPPFAAPRSSSGHTQESGISTDVNVVHDVYRLRWVMVDASFSLHVLF